MKIALLLILAALPAFSQETNLPTLSVGKHGWTTSGELVLAITIKASSQPVQLGDDRDENHVEPFTLATSALVDTYSQQKFSPLPLLPRRPYFGSMSGIIALNAGDSITFGVAFPRPPNPPLDKKGQPLDYEFILEIPGMKPLKFSIPLPDSSARPS